MVGRDPNVATRKENMTVNTFYKRPGKGPSVPKPQLSPPMATQMHLISHHFELERIFEVIQCTFVIVVLFFETGSLYAVQVGKKLTCTDLSL
jgi:hypothetical protein